MTEPSSSSLQKTSPEDRILRRIPRTVLFASGVLSLPVAFLFDPVAAGLFFLGGTLSAVNFFWLMKEVSKILVSQGRKSISSLLRGYGLRLVLILGVFFVIIYFFSKKSIAFAAGFSLIVPVFLVEAAIGFSKIKQWKN